MTKKDLVLLKEIKRFPKHLREELIDFVHFLKTKMMREKRETAIASESSLKKDWLKPEEDEAWQDL